MDEEGRETETNKPSDFKYVSFEASDLLAISAYDGVSLPRGKGDLPPTLSLGLAGALASGSRVPRSGQRCHVTVVTDTGTGHHVAVRGRVAVRHEARDEVGREEADLLFGTFGLLCVLRSESPWSSSSSSSSSSDDDDDDDCRHDDDGGGHVHSSDLSSDLLDLHDRVLEICTTGKFEACVTTPESCEKAIAAGYMNLIKGEEEGLGEEGEEGGTTTARTTTTTRGIVQSIKPGENGNEGTELPETMVVVPGSFNPFHRGHERLAKAALDKLRSERASEGEINSEEDTSTSTSTSTNTITNTNTNTRHESPALYYELSITNADKPRVASSDAVARLAPVLHTHKNVLLTTVPFFHEKARAYRSKGAREVLFVVGWDTFVRVVEGRYYGGEEVMEGVLEGMKEDGARFVVGGRKGDGGEFMGGKFRGEGILNGRFEGLFLFLEEDEFRVDLSSTEIRARSKMEEK